MEWLILALILIATYNATAATFGWDMKWTVAAYWVVVAIWWLCKAMEVA